MSCRLFAPASHTFPRQNCVCRRSPSGKPTRVSFSGEGFREFFALLEWLLPLTGQPGKGVQAQRARRLFAWWGFSVLIPRPPSPVPTCERAHALPQAARHPVPMPGGLGISSEKLHDGSILCWETIRRDAQSTSSGSLTSTLRVRLKACPLMGRGRARPSRRPREPQENGSCNTAPAFAHKRQLNVRSILWRATLRRCRTGYSPCRLRGNDGALPSSTTLFGLS